MTPRRIQLSRKKGFNLAAVAGNGLPTVVVSRPSKWGNPYKVADYVCVDHDDKPLSRAEALPLQRELAHRDFDAWLFCVPEGEKLAAEARKELRGKNLACWCPLPADGEEDFCHAAVLLRVAADDDPESSS
jgi:hypothetical protein